MIKISFKGKVSAVGTTVLYTVPAGKIAKVKLRAENPTRTIPSNGSSSSSSSSSSLVKGNGGSSLFVGEEKLLSCRSSDSRYEHDTLIVENDMLVTAFNVGNNDNITYASIMNFLFNFDGVNKAIDVAVAVRYEQLRYVGKNEFILFEGENIRVENTATGTGVVHETNYDFYIYEDDL